MTWWVVLVAVMVASAITAGIALGRAREKGEVERLQEAMDELEAEIGKALAPVVDATLGRLARWLERRKDAP